MHNVWPSPGLVGYTIYTFSGLLSCNGILPCAKFTLRPSLALSYIGSVTARHSSSGRQTKFASLSRGHHLYSSYICSSCSFLTLQDSCDEEVVLHLKLTKCIRILLYGPEACPLRKTDLNSSGFVVNRLFMKLFQTGNIDLVECFQSYFCFELPSAIHDRRARKFDLRYRNHSNLFCQMIGYL